MSGAIRLEDNDDEESQHGRVSQFLDESRDLLEDSVEVVSSKAMRFWNGFTSFAVQDNVLEVAVGLIIAAAFTSIVTSFVSDILLPPLSLLPFINRNMEEKFVVLRRGPGYHHNGTHGYNTLDQAAADGAVVMSYGTFLNKIFNFLGVGLALYFVALIYEWGSKDSIIKHTIKCKYCRKRISDKAKRCVNCTSWLDGREDK